VDLRLLDGAKEDIRNGWFFYERQAPWLGDLFLDAIEADVVQLPAYTGIHLQVDGFHRMLIKCFPFAPYYLIEESSIDIYAVLDCHSSSLISSVMPGWIIALSTSLSSRFSRLFRTVSAI